MLTIDLLRHGALQGGIKYRGQIEAELTPDGHQSMNRHWISLSKHIDCIISSPLSRCAYAANDWAQQANIPCIIEPRLIEMRYGAWENKTPEQIEQISPGMLQQWRRNPTGMRPPGGGESPEELRLRIASWWQEITSTMNDQHLLIIGHSGSLRMLITHALNLPISATREMDMPYACHKRLRYHQGSAQLIEP